MLANSDTRTLRFVLLRLNQAMDQVPRVLEHTSTYTWRSTESESRTTANMHRWRRESANRRTISRATGPGNRTEKVSHVVSCDLDETIHVVTWHHRQNNREPILNKLHRDLPGFRDSGS